LASTNSRRSIEAQLRLELKQAMHTISFLHGCLTNPTHKYPYPEMTLRDLARLGEISEKAPKCTAGLFGRHPRSKTCPVHDLLPPVGWPK
jgi:hypothetical protein